MRIGYTYLLIVIAGLAGPGLMGYERPNPPYAPAAGETTSTAIAYDDDSILAWATGVSEVVFGEEVADDGDWKNPQYAIGPATGGEFDVIVLGRGGSITLEIDSGISDKNGFDFVVFENGFSDTFLELAYVEVSSDGQHFVRFPNYSLTAESVGTWGHVQPEYVNGFAGKYRNGYGTPFDLSVLVSAYEGVLNNYDNFSLEFEDQLLENYPYLDLDSIKYIRLFDIVGDGTYRDCEGYVIYDPYPTFITGGFDLEAVGVLNTSVPDPVLYNNWAVQNGLSGIHEDDFDNDGWADLLEYQFSTDPKDALDKPVFEFRRNAESDGYEVQFHLSGKSQWQCNLYYSSNGVEWGLLSESPVPPVSTDSLTWIDGEPFIEQVLDIPDAEGRGFLRWEVNTAVPPN